MAAGNKAALMNNASGLFHRGAHGGADHDFVVGSGQREHGPSAVRLYMNAQDCL